MKDRRGLSPRSVQTKQTQGYACCVRICIHSPNTSRGRPGSLQQPSRTQDHGQEDNIADEKRDGSTTPSRDERRREPPCTEHSHLWCTSTAKKRKQNGELNKKTNLKTQNDEETETNPLHCANPLRSPTSLTTSTPYFS